MSTKLKIYQADDNDQLSNNINKFYNVIDALVIFLGIDKNRFTEKINNDVLITDYEKILNEINIYVDFVTSSKINDSNSNLDEVINHLKNEVYDIYIIDLKWGDNPDGGIEIIEKIKRKTSPENIIIYSQHDKLALKNLQKNIYNQNFQHIDTEDIEVDLPEILKNSFKKIREAIILDCSNKYNIKKAINANDDEFFNGEIDYDGKSYTYKNLFVGTNFSNQQIADNIDSFLDKNNYKINFPEDAHLFLTRETYVKSYVLMNSNQDIHDLLNYLSLNLFIELYNKLSKEKFLEQIYSINKAYIAKSCPSINIKKLYSNEEWINFYKKLISRRVFILWDKYYSQFDSKVLDNHIKNKSKHTVIYSKISMLLSSGTNNLRSQKTKYEENLIRKELGFIKRGGKIVYTRNNAFVDELEFLSNTSFSFIKTLIQYIDSLNKSRAKSYCNKTNLIFNFWDIKEMLSNKNIINDDDIFKLFKKNINDGIEESEFNETYKNIFFNTNILNLNEALELLAEKTKRP